MTSTRFQLHFDPEGDILAAAKACEADVFLSTYGNTTEEWNEEYGPYEDSSVFLALSESGGDVVAACRLILPSGVGLKSLEDTARPPWFVDGKRSARAAGMDLAETWDVATIAVRKGLRGVGMLAAGSMYHGIVMATRANDLRWVVMIMDERARRLLTALNLVTHALPGTAPGPYLGSTSSTPLWADVAEMMDIQRRLNPEGHRLISQGIGLDGISVPGPDGFRLRGSKARFASVGSRLELLKTA